MNIQELDALIEEAKAPDFRNNNKIVYRDRKIFIEGMKRQRDFPLDDREFDSLLDQISRRYLGMGKKVA